MLDKKRILHLFYRFTSLGAAFATGCLWGLDIAGILVFLLLLIFSFLRLYLHRRIEKSQILDLSRWFASYGIAYALGCLLRPNISPMLGVLLLLTFLCLELYLHHRIEKSQNITAEKKGCTEEKT
jgi:hypothetical protein